MAPVDPNANNKGRARGAGFKKSRKGPPGAGKKRKWVPENKAFDGSLQEGQGFAFKRKQKVRHEYNKILRGQRKGRRGVAPTQTGGYPEHLKHLYLAEEEKLQHEEQANRLRRLRGRTAERGDGPVGSDVTGTETNADEATPKEDRPPLIKKKMKTSSYTRTKQEYSRRQEERERKREAYLKDKTEREEALRKYKEKKLATYQVLKKKTKKGQPNLNLQMELLLQKIQAARK
ncbi:thyroid transcription factor 1-associated protein 26 homolog [Denticeps clupeoides]|uniref:Thyroid transcription factor 1-associated protein 26 n=1 Tax=Denticeps clupeoides TaxID=299321 RepID=A0AAY4EGD2_9TELE|nr:thyroid transcription factor 1-associated protein 26 [Denticeps clupeoides]